jgi:hypothetical protein
MKVAIHLGHTLILIAVSVFSQYVFPFEDPKGFAAFGFACCIGILTAFLFPPFVNVDNSTEEEEK